VSYLSASAVVIHYEEAVYQVYGSISSVWTFSPHGGLRVEVRQRTRISYSCNCNSVVINYNLS